MKITVIGAGLAGLAVTLGLIEKDPTCEVTLVERRATFEREGATFGLAIGAVKALEDISPSVVEELKETGIHMPLHGGYMLPWWEVRDALLRKVQQSNRVSIRMGLNLDQIYDRDNREEVATEKQNAEQTLANDEDGAVVATFKDSDVKISSDVIIGADGVHSTVRKKVLKLDPPKIIGNYVWRGHINVNAGEESVATNKSLKALLAKRFAPTDNSNNDRIDGGIYKFIHFGPNLRIAFFNFDEKFPGMLLWVFTCMDSKHSNFEVVSGRTEPMDLIDQYYRELEGKCPGDNESTSCTDGDYQLLKLVFEASKDGWLPKAPATIAVTNLHGEREWGGKGLVTIVGDAAHAIRPVTGVGGMLAFEDAAVLSTHLAQRHSKVKPSAKDLEYRLRAFEKQCLSRRRIISRDETIRGYLAFKLGFYGVPKQHPQYLDWLHSGHDASHEPPVDHNSVYSEVFEQLGIADENECAEISLGRIHQK